jgi:hypothetical protein
MTIPVAQLAWMAGVIDLKGKMIYKTNQKRAEGSKQITLYIESTQFPIIKKLGEMTGTNPEFKTTRDRHEGWYRRGCEEHCPNQHVHVVAGEFPPAARWTISGAPMAVVLHSLTPYLIQDKGFTEAIAYAYENMVLSGQGAGANVSSLRRLHGLGWRIPDIINAGRPNLLSPFAVAPKEELELVT